MRRFTHTFPQRSSAFLLCLALLVGLLPQTAFAAGTDTGKAIQIGASGISGFDIAKGGTGYDYIYYGEWNSSPIKWRVLDTKTNMANATEGDGLFLLSDVLLGTGDYGGVYFGSSNVWQNSTAQEWCETFYSDSLTKQEQSAVLETTKSDGAFTSSSTYRVPFAASENILNGDKVFFLSAEEAENSAYGFTDDNARIANYSNHAGVWWLRSPRANRMDTAGAVSLYGYVYSYSSLVYTGWAARPAFNLNLNSVLFTSAAVGGKIPAASSGGNQGDVGADAIFKIDDTNTDEWKLTLLDDNHKNFEISNATTNSSGDTIAFSYSGAQTGTNEYISVVIEDKGEITHYGRILQLDGTTNGANGRASLALPEGVTLDENTKLYVFNEQYNGDKMTDYASLLWEFDTTAPTLSNGSATRTGETTATVKFTSDEAGEYYYTVVESDEAAPTIDTTGAGTACVSGENTISLTSLSDAGAKDIYIVAKDAVENVSQSLKISIPEYIAPSYSISATPSALDFGSMTEDYSSAPAAQTVTIQNTGNQTITLNQPAADDFNVGALSATELTAGGTATFTVQPKTGLAVGSHSETLTISGSNGASASVKLSFTVNAVYILTVNLNGGSGSTTGGEYAENAVVNIDAGSRSNYRFAGWTSSNGGSFVDASSANTTFTMPAADTTITANWQYDPPYIPPTYAVTTPETTGGTVTVSPSRASSGRTVTITASPDPGFALESLTVLDSRGEEITLTDKGDGKYTFTMPASKVTVEATFAPTPLPFDDVASGTWYEEAVRYVYFRGVMEGMSATTFQPNGTLSRAMAVQIFYNLEGQPDVSDENLGYPYEDVNAEEWYGDAVYWARLTGVATGYGDGTFHPSASITRQEFAQMLYNYAKHKGYDLTAAGDLSTFPDSGSVADWAEAAMSWANGNQLINGHDDGTIDAAGIGTRAQAASILMRFDQNLVKN